MIAVLCILFGGLTSFYVLLIVGGSPPAWMSESRVMDLSLMKGLGLVDGIVWIVCGINFMQAANWSRWVFVADSIVSSVIMGVILADKIETCVTTFVFRIICIVIIFLPDANDYFRGRRR